jgi:DHA1 family bicyclomycin/chloramphenicol resistance-like MFS transporter
LGGLLALTLVSVGFGALSPALAEIQDAFGGGAGLGALLVSGFGAGRLLAGFPAGVLVDRVGADRVVLGGALLFLVGSLVGWAAPHFPILAIGRFIQGAGCAVVPAGVLARMMAGAAAERAGGPMAVYQAAITIGVALGPAVGGPLAAVAGWRSALLFCAAAGLAACALVLPSSGTGAPRGVPARHAADERRPRRPGWRAGLVGWSSARCCWWRSGSP